MDEGVVVSKMGNIGMQCRQVGIQVELGMLRRLNPKYHHLYNPSKYNHKQMTKSQCRKTNPCDGYAPVWIHHLEMGKPWIGQRPLKSITDE